EQFVELAAVGFGPAVDAQIASIENGVVDSAMRIRNRPESAAGNARDARLNSHPGEIRESCGFLRPFGRGGCDAVYVKPGLRGEFGGGAGAAGRSAGGILRQLRQRQQESGLHERRKRRRMRAGTPMKTILSKPASVRPVVAGSGAAWIPSAEKLA